MEVILIIKDSGFTLNEIKNIIAFPEEELNFQNDLFTEIIIKKIEVIENKIEDLYSLKKGLEKVVYNIENYNIRSCIEIKKKIK